MSAVNKVAACIIVGDLTKSGRSVVSCIICKDYFEEYNSKIKTGKYGLYCSKNCSKKSPTRGKYTRTVEHKILMKERTKHNKPSRETIMKGAAARRGIPPSDLCKKVASERWSGPGNPKWRGGTARLPYAGNWQAVRKIIINRDKICQDCHQWNSKSHGMHVHHLDWNRMKNELDNLVLLCSSCHYKREWDSRREN